MNSEVPLFSVSPLYFREKYALVTLQITVLKTYNHTHMLLAKKEYFDNLGDMLMCVSYCHSDKKVDNHFDTVITCNGFFYTVAILILLK